MLDDLLGRAELKTRIERLEDERDSLEARLEAESERRADAVSERQAAEERVNRLEDRVAELEDRVERAGGDGDGDGTAGFRRVTTLRGERRTTVLDRLRSVDAGPEGALTAAVEGSGPAPGPVREAFGRRAPLLDRAAPCVALTDDAGVIAAALVPPFPPEPFHGWDRGFRLEPAWFDPAVATGDGRLALALVRADLFALGVYEDGERVATESFRTDVEENHSKGGFSQARYERRRDEQVAGHLDRVREALADHGGDRLVLAGERTVLDDLSVPAARRVAVDASGDPEDALAAARADALATRLYVL